MKQKDFKKLEEQIDILKAKGLTINDYNEAYNILLRENYFFLNGYRHLFMKSNTDKTYIEGTTFDEVYSLFLFDRWLRNILFKNILIIENNTKSIISYELSLKYGYQERQYLNTKNFTNNPEKRKQVADTIKKMTRQIKSNAAAHSATMHYVNNYGYIPLWVLVKVLSFGMVGELYNILKKEDQIKISEMYDLDPDCFANYLVMLSNYRNLCAHEDIVFENKTQRQIGDTKYHRLLNIEIQDDNYIYGKNDIFALIIILKEMLQVDEFKLLMFEIKGLIDNLQNHLHSIPINKVLNRMGFPENWNELEFMEGKNYERQN